MIIFKLGSLNDRLARIGLMVAPMCLKHLAESIYENVLEPMQTIKLKTDNGVAALKKSGQEII